MVSGLALDDFTLPREGSDTLRRVLARVWPMLVRDACELPLTDPALRPLHARVNSSMRALAARDMGAAVRIARRPSLAARTAYARSVADDRAASTALCDLAFELALAGALGGDIALPRLRGAWPTLRSPARGSELALDDGLSSVALADGAIVLGGTRCSLAGALDQPGVTERAAWQPIDGRVALALVDDNPVAARSLHPERAGNAIDLGGRSADAWCASLREAFAIVEAHLPGVARERRLLAQTVCPVGVDDARHFSCSYEGAPGAMYLSLHPDPVKMAEAVVHEFQHDKLHALLRLDPLLDNARAEGFRSPVRPDPRPLRGVLLAAHAFLTVETLYRAMRDAGHEAARHPRFDQRLAAVREANRVALDALDAHARPTPLGRALLDEMGALEAALRRA